ncbi:unnamed protein product [Arctia plantaginis]|uniref:Uncharacterized protein n=1 Tax=Arctia plantaginis TaxID=874455 RepID=A0A8S0YME1_ARCPL|nr:unnamed protein product [Arctia plantaginis]
MFTSHILFMRSNWPIWNAFMSPVASPRPLVSDISGCGYHLATMLGLLPAQVINVYLGSTLRSMHDVLHESHVTGYIVFAFQILIGITLMVWVVQKARKELTIAIMQAELGRETISTSSSSSIS